MNCNPCCGCLPPITTYDPSVANNFPTILQQVEYLKALLKKYPSQQWFITQEKVTEETVKLDSTKIPLRGRGIQVGDFILGNTVDGTILIFQYTGVMTDLTYYVVEYIGIYTNQDVAEEALAKAQAADTKAQNAQSTSQAADTKAQQALDLATTNEQNKVDKIEIGLGDIVYAASNNRQTYYAVARNEAKPSSIVRRDENGNIIGNSFWLSSGAKFTANSFITKGSKKIDYPEPSGNTSFATIESVNNTVNNLKFKTLFGKTITGSGNIDLYHHEISYSDIFNGINVAVNFEHYTSNNLKAYSLGDVVALLGNTFKKGIFGSITIIATGKALTPLYINETNIYYIGEDGTVQNQLLTENFSDTVTTT